MNFKFFSCEGLVQNWIKNQIEKLKTENRKRKRKRNKKKGNQLTWAKTCAETGPSGEPSHLHAVQQPNSTSPADVWDRGTHLSASSSGDINGADGYCRRGNSSFTPPPLRPRAPPFLPSSSPRSPRSPPPLFPLNRALSLERFLAGDRGHRRG